MKRSLTAPLLCLAVGVTAACRPEERVSHDLVALFPEAEVLHETAEVDFGTDAADAHVVDGFSSGERAADGTTFAWSQGPASELRLFVAEPRPLAITFRCWPFVYDGAPPQSVRLSWNGMEIAEIELAPAPGEYRVAVPAGHQVSGDNVVRARYRYHREPRAVLPGAHDARSVAVAWDWLRVEGAWARREAAARGAGEQAAIAIPAGTRVEYFVTAPPDSTFAVDAVRSETPSSLAVTTETLFRHDVRHLESPSRPTEIELPSSGGLVRLSLQASTEDVLLRRPVIVTTAPPSGGRPSRERKRRPNIIVYLIDTLRADHLGCYGYGEPTPRIDALAADGTLFEKALAQSSWTKPATASILTGLHPRAHTANEREDALPRGIRTLPEELTELGYETAGLVVNANVSAPFGFDRGFETFELLLHDDGILGARGDELVDRAIEWLAARSDGDRPFFLYLHTTDPHDPYGTTGFHSEGFGSVAFMESLEENRVELSPDERERLVELYDEDVAFADAQLGRLVDALQHKGLYEDALIILLSDHGEEFDEHGRWRHGKTLYQEQLEIPLIVKWPGGAGAGRRVGSVAQHVDVVPTVLDYLGRGPRPDLPGRSLLPLVEGRDDELEPPVLSYLRLDGREVESVIAGDEKLIRYLDYDAPVAPFELFDLASDGPEAKSLEEERRRVAAFLDAYRRHAAPEPAVAPVRVTIDETVERQLRALGYVR